ncbi:hypothetical protein [Bradyrhizobium elkanii]|uniref:hypothetical protein n=1 Tax=Bradyrhizobium elkanii TaxID=29448 RepID=UPI003D2362C8
MNSITINDVAYTTARTVTIANGRILLDGKDVTPDAKEIHIAGDISHLQADVCLSISVSGNVGHVVTQSGSVNVEGNVNGSVQTMSGSIDCSGSIGGSATTMSGNIRHCA